MSLTQYEPLVEWPTTIVCDTFRSIASGAVMDVSVGLFAECIENGHMPADLHGFMTMAPSKNVNPSVAVC